MRVRAPRSNASAIGMDACTGGVGAACGAAGTVVWGMGLVILSGLSLAGAGLVVWVLTVPGSRHASIMGDAREPVKREPGAQSS